jgi:hypothetical protein
MYGREIGEAIASRRCRVVDLKLTDIVYASGPPRGRGSMTEKELARAAAHRLAISVTLRR